MAPASWLERGHAGAGVLWGRGPSCDKIPARRASRARPRPVPFDRAALHRDIPGPGAPTSSSSRWTGRNAAGAHPEASRGNGPCSLGKRDDLGQKAEAMDPSALSPPSSSDRTSGVAFGAPFWW